MVNEYTLKPERRRLAHQHRHQRRRPARLDGVRPYWVRILSFYGPDCLGELTTELLPEASWKTTSDTIALLLAQLIGAQRCVLLKACPVAPKLTIFIRLVVAIFN